MDVNKKKTIKIFIYVYMQSKMLLASEFLSNLSISCFMFLLNRRSELKICSLEANLHVIRFFWYYDDVGHTKITPIYVKKKPVQNQLFNCLYGISYFPKFTINKKVRIFVLGILNS